MSLQVHAKTLKTKSTLTNGVRDILRQFFWEAVLDPRPHFLKDKERVRLKIAARGEDFDRLEKALKRATERAKEQEIRPRLLREEKRAE